MSGAPGKAVCFGLSPVGISRLLRHGYLENS